MTTETPTLESLTVSKASDVDRRMKVHAIVFAAVVIACHLPLVLLHFRNLWMMRPHYQFFPLLLIGVGWLMWHRCPQWSFDTGAPRWSTALLVLGGLILAVGTLLWSPLLAMVALILSLGGLMGRYAAPGQWRDWVPVWLVLWLVVPPPLGLDFRLITWLQSSTSQMASRVMDLLRILHLMEGNVLVLPGNRMLVDEACSGVNSVLVLFVLTALYAAAQRRPLIWTSILLLSSVAWAWAGNTVRVTSIAIAQAWYGIDLSTGWEHEVLGYVTISLALIWLISTDYCLGFLLGPIRLRGRDLSEFTASDTPLTKAWNWLVGGRTKQKHRMDGVVEEADSVMASATGDQAEGQTLSLSEPARGRHSVSGGSFSYQAVSGLIAIGLLGLLQLVAFAVPVMVRSQPDIDRGMLSDLFSETDLSSELNDWSIVEYEIQERESGSAFGQFSSRWRLRRGLIECIVSVDRPFWGWHDLTICYRGTGWILLDRHDLGSRHGAESQSRYVEAQFSRPTGEYGWLVFGLFDQRGIDLMPPLSGAPSLRFVDRVSRSPLLSRLLGEDDLRDASMCFQLQVFVSSITTPNAEEQAELRELFFEVRRRLARRGLDDP